MRERPRLPFQRSLPVLRVEREDAGLVPRLLPAEFLVLAVAAAVARHDEQAAMQNRRRTQTVLAVERVVAIRPNDLAGKVQRRETAVAETGINALAIGGGRGRGVSVAAFLAARHLLEDFLVPENFSGLADQAKARGTSRRSRWRW